MKSVVAMFGILALTLLSSGCWFIYPRHTVRIHVVDEDGQPIHRATVGVGYNVSKSANPFDGWERRGSRTKKTDKNGFCVIRVRGLGRLHPYAKKEGFYTGSLRRDNLDGGTVDVRLTLRRIGKTTPMYANDLFHLRLPARNVDMGYDLLDRDWLPPYGKGRVADLVMHLEWEWNSRHDFRTVLTLSVPAPGAGFLPIPAAALHPGSAFPYPRAAPTEDDYQPSFSMRKPPLSAHDVAHYYIRIPARTAAGQAGTGFLYGRLLGPRYSVLDEDEATVSFHYFITPDGTPNLEWDGINLFTGKKGILRSYGEPRRME